MTAIAGKRVLLTGGAGGVGRAVARMLVGQGARVLATDREGAALERLAAELDHAEGFDFVAADLASTRGIDRLFAQADALLGGPDILIACAGLGADPLMEMAESDWRYVIESNLVSYVACTQRAIERMRRAEPRDGMIILVGSISVHIKAVGESVYNAAKGGVAAFAETLRKEMMPEGIRITLIEPGAIATAMQPCSEAERARQTEEQKMLDPAQVAEAILFAATRPPGVDIVTLRIEPLNQKIR